MFVSLQEFFDNYRIKNGKQPNETVLNKGLMRLKREVRELESVFNIILGNELPAWSNTIYYETDEYVQHGGAFYKSLVSQNLGIAPGVTAGWATSWVVINIDFEDIRNLLPSKADVATTLGGYGITDAYTKDEVDNIQEALVDGAPVGFRTLGTAKSYTDVLAATKVAHRNIPTTPKGTFGDKHGDIAVDADWVYFCYRDFVDNTFPIWKRLPLPSEGTGVTW
jgi:hypothetical protein